MAQAETKKYFKTIVRVEVLTADAPWEGDLEGLNYAITEGDCSGTSLEPEVTELTEKEMAAALEAQGSDPSCLIKT